jgi:hypothetical protein
MVKGENGTLCPRGMNLGNSSSCSHKTAFTMGAPFSPKLLRKFTYHGAEISVVEPCRDEFSALVAIDGKVPEMLFNPVRGGYFRNPKSAARYAKSYARGKAWKPRPKKVPRWNPPNTSVV